MAISEIWTISGPASGTLAALNVESLGFQFASADVDVAEMVFADDGHAATGWTVGDAAVISRDGAAFFRGKIAPEVRSGNPARDARTVRIRSAWHELGRLPFAQDWTHWNGTAVATQSDHARFRLAAEGSGGRYTDTREALTTVINYAIAKGVGLTLGALPTGKQVRLMDGHSQLCADLIRQILRWHPDCVAVLDHTSATPILNIRPASALPGVSISGSGRPLTDFDLSNPTADEAPTNVIISWEALSEDADEASDIPLRRQIYRDTAGGSTVGIGTVLVTMSVALPDATAPTAREEKMIVRDIPEAADTDEYARKWWLSHSPLKRLGLTALQCKLPTSTVGDIVAHTIEAVPLPDADELDEGVEIPTFWTDDLARLPREILTGNVQEFMRRSYGQVRARVTMGLAKVSVDALPAAKKAEVLRLVRPDTREIDSVVCYLIDLDTQVAATNALSRSYYGTDGGAQGADGSVPTIAEQIVPGLAAAYFDAATAPRWEGSFSLTEQEAGATRLMGRVVNVMHDARPEWATMRALVQRVSINVATGQTRVAVGRAAHLSLQDHLELMKTARAAEYQRARTPSVGYDPDDETAPAWGSGTGGTVTGTGYGPAETSQVIPTAQGLRPGFEVVRLTATTLSVVPSAISGFSVLGEIPVVGSTALDATPAPVVTVTASAEQWVALRVEVVPESVLSGDGETYIIEADAGILSGDIAAEVYASQSAMASATDLPEIDPETGAVVTNGVYVIPLAKQNADGSLVQIYNGPLGLSMCASGSLSVIAPLRVVVEAAA